MSSRLTHLFLMATLLLLAWSGAIGVASLANEVEPGALPVLARYVGGSELLALIAVALVIVGAGWGVLIATSPIAHWARQLLSGAETTSVRARPISDIDEIKANLGTRFPDIDFSRFDFRRASLPGPAAIDGRIIYLSPEVVAALRSGYTGTSDIYIAGCIVLLHEIGHAITGDIGIRHHRSSISQLNAAVAGFVIAVTLNIGLFQLFLPGNILLSVVGATVAVALISTFLADGLRQIERETEAQVDLFALRCLEKAFPPETIRRGLEALQEHALDKGFTGNLRIHPNFAVRRQIWFGQRRWRGFLLLWLAALVLFRLFQDDRIDPTCRDCDALAQVTYDLFALAAMVLLTIVGVRVLRERGIASARLTVTGCMTALAAAAGTLICARLFTQGEHLGDWIAVFGPVMGPLRFVFASGDLSTWLASIHVVIIGFAMFLLRARPDMRNRPEPAPPRQPFTIHVVRPQIRKILELPARAVYNLAISIDLALAIGMTAITLLLIVNLTMVATTEQTWLTAAIYGATAVALCVAAHAPTRLLMILEAVLVGTAATLSYWVGLAMAAFAAANGLDLTVPQAQVEVGQLMRNTPSTILAYIPLDAGTLLPGAFGCVAVVTGFAILRLYGLKLKENEE